jgi:hypothetical protein
MRLPFLVAALVAACAPVFADDYKLEQASAAPDGLPAAIAAQVAPTGQRVVGPQRPLCTIWLAKETAAKEAFEPSLAIKYPFAPGQFMGVLQVPRRAGLTDFRGNEIEEGLYTLRYGQQPMDGNHIGTSPTADFLLALPVAVDEDPATIGSVEDLFKKSAEASGTTHPAIFTLLPVGDAKITESGLTHDEEQSFWILQMVASGAKDAKHPLRLVVVGQSEG